MIQKLLLSEYVLIGGMMVLREGLPDEHSESIVSKFMEADKKNGI